MILTRYMMLTLNVFAYHAGLIDAENRESDLEKGSCLILVSLRISNLPINLWFVRLSQAELAYAFSAALLLHAMIPDYLVHHHRL